MSESNQPIERAQDRLTDRVLAEAVGGESPPDLTAAIADRVADAKATPASSGNPRQTRRAWVVLLATAASLMVAMIVWRENDGRFGERAVALADEPAKPQIVSDFSSVSGGSKAIETEPIDTNDDRFVIGEAVNGGAGMGGQVAAVRDIESSTKALNQQGLVESEVVPFPAGVPMVYPDAERWRNIKSLREKYSQVDVSPPVGMRAQPRQHDGQMMMAMDKLWFGTTGNDRHRPYVSSQVSDSDLRFFEPVDLSFGDKYAAIQENAFIKPEGAKALSTFSIDVDTASYTGVRQYLLDARRLPPADSVRIEELVNYFDYGYAAPAADSEDPFAATLSVAACPWKPAHRLVRIGIKGREVEADKRPLSNLVFLVDVSGSMNEPNKLPLVVEGLKALVERLGENDRVAIVVYAGSEGLVLPSTSGTKKDEIRSALGRLQAGGSTAGGAGLKLAYEIAERHKIPGGVNRVVLCTDGDFNVGLTGTEELAELVESRGKEQGIFLTVLGFGRGNLNDAMLETISGRGDGHYAYIDSEREARRVLSRDLSGTLITIAKDVKLQVEFNPAKVGAYRLIGYENRVMAAKDFNDDTKDAGEIGAGHTVTALYEIVPVGIEPPAPPVDGLKYQPTDESTSQPEASAPGTNDAKVEGGRTKAEADELLTLKIRYKQPEGGASKKLEFPLDEPAELLQPSGDFRWAAAVAEFGMLLRNSRHAGEATLDTVLEAARGAVGEDPQGYRAEFLDMVRKAQAIKGGK